MTLLAYAIACIAFCAAFVALRILQHTRIEFGRIHEAVGTMRSSELSDAEKEVLVRRAAVDALPGFGKLMARVAALLLATAAPVWLADMAGLTSADAVIKLALRLDVMLATTIIAAVTVYAARSFRQSTS